MEIERAPHRTGAMVRALSRKLSGFFVVSEQTAADIIELCLTMRTFLPRETIIRADEPYPGIFLVENGWAVRARHLENGARQIVNVALPGDFIGINALLFDDSDFDITAQTDVTAYYIEPDRIRGVFGRDPDLAAAVFWASVQEESILAERIVSLGRRSARVRMAHVLCEMVSRIEIVTDTAPLAEAEEERAHVMIPLTQEDFSDILGISLVHTNKTLRALEREGIVSFRKGLLVIHDRGSLERAAGFDNGYLHFTQAAGKRKRVLVD